MGVREPDPIAQLSLPPGFRFYPTDEELLMKYLCRKVAGHHFALEIIGDIDLYKFDPWDLPSKATFGEKEWYFFSPRDKKYPNGSRPNRVAGCGYWKATGTDKIISSEGRRVGIKKALVFYIGKAPKGTKTNWIMHEYRLMESTPKNGSMRLDDWVLCRIYKKSSSSSSDLDGVRSKKLSPTSASSSSQNDDAMENLLEINDRLFCLQKINSTKNLHEEDKNMDIQQNFNWAALVGPTNSEAQLVQQIGFYGPTIHHFSGKAASEEVCGPRLDRSGFFKQNEFGSMQDIFDPFRGWYPIPDGGSGFT